MLTLLVALGILAVIAISTAIPPNDQLNPSSRSAGTLGTLALYTWFSNLGLDTSRISARRPARSGQIVSLSCLFDSKSASARAAKAS